MNKKEIYKLLGVLGGMGPLASAYFYERVTLLTKVNRDADHINMIISSMTRTPDRTSFILGYSNDNPLQYLIKDALMLEQCGVDIIALTCNTSHYFINDLRRSVNVPIINMIELTVAYVKQKNIKKAGIMATKGTYQTKLYEQECIKHNIEPFIPCEKIQDEIMNIIYNQIKRNGTIEINSFKPIVDYFVANNCEIIILGCTELSIVEKQINLPNLIIDPINILAKYCIKIFNKSSR